MKPMEISTSIGPKPSKEKSLAEKINRNKFITPLDQQTLEK
jgi:hypothetical protein